MAPRRFLTALCCIAALPALAEQTCPDRFRIVGWPGGAVRAGALTLDDFAGGTLVVSGADVVDAKPVLDYDGAPAVQSELTEDGRRAFAQYTRTHLGKPLAIVHDDRLLTAPTVRDAITGGQGIITGLITSEDAATIAAQLRDKSCPAGS